MTENKPPLPPREGMQRNDEGHYPDQASNLPERSGIQRDDKGYLPGEGPLPDRTRLPRRKDGSQWMPGGDLLNEDKAPEDIEYPDDK